MTYSWLHYRAAKDACPGSTRPLRYAHIRRLTTDADVKKGGARRSTILLCTRADMQEREFNAKRYTAPQVLESAKQ